MFKQEDTLEEFLVSGETLFANASDPQISVPMEAYGYPPSRVEEGRVIFNSAKALFEKQKMEYSEQYAATEKLYSEMQQFNKSYVKHVKLSRVAFEDDAEKTTILKLNGRRERIFGKWVLQAEAYYKNVDADEAVKAKLLEYGISAEAITSSIAKISELKELHFNQEKETGEAQAATKERDAKLDELDKWLSGFVKVARIALEDNPQLLEMLGIKVAS